MSGTEVTVKINTEKSMVIDIFKNLGYICVDSFVLKDFYFTHLGDLLNVSYSDLLEHSILLRQKSDASGVISQSLCHKSKTIDDRGNVISESKTSTAIVDLEACKMVFERAGLNNWCNLVNKSKVYKKGEISLVLQDVQGLGLFLEVEEYPSIAGLASDAKFSALCSFVDSLGLDIGPDYSCKKPFLALHNRESE